MALARRIKTHYQKRAHATISSKNAQDLESYNSHLSASRFIHKKSWIHTWNDWNDDATNDVAWLTAFIHSEINIMIVFFVHCSNVNVAIMKGRATCIHLFKRSKHASTTCIYYSSYMYVHYIFIAKAAYNEGCSKSSDMTHVNVNVFTARWDREKKTQ